MEKTEQPELIPDIIQELIQKKSLTNISKFIIEGEYLAPDDYDKVLVGSFFIKKEIIFTF